MFQIASVTVNNLRILFFFHSVSGTSIKTMTKCCIVPKCRTGYKSLKVKRSIFKVPTNAERLKKWQAAIPCKILSSLHYVCEKHFEEKYILRKYIKHDANGKVIAEVPYIHPRLHVSAIPTIFENSEETLESARISNVADNESKTDISMNQVAALPINDLSDVTIDEGAVSMNAHAGIKCARLPMNVVAEDTGIDECILPDNCNITDAKRILMDGTVADTASEPKTTQRIFVSTNIADEKIADKISIASFVISPVTITENGSSPQPNSFNNTTLPAPWVVGYLTEQANQLVFSYMTATSKQGICTPITQKSVILDGQKNLDFYVHGKLVDAEKTNLVQTLDNISLLPNILSKFKRMNQCCGVGDVNLNYMQTENAYKNYVDQWHHNDCSLLWKNKRCDSCSRLRKQVLQKERRSRNPHHINRIHGLSNPMDEYKLRALRKKIIYERREKNRAKCRVSTLKESIRIKKSFKLLLKSKISRRVDPSHTPR